MASTPPKAGRKEWLGVAALALPCMLVTMDLSVLFLAVPALSADLHPSATELLWITDVYGFLIAGALIVMGTLGDRYGRRRVLVIGSVAFGIASVLAALSSTPEMLIAARGLQGLAGATLIPSTMSLLFGMFPDEGERMKALGLISAGFTGGAAIGPILGGTLLDLVNWHAVFLINVPAMVAVVLAVPRLVPEIKNPSAPNVDVASAVMLMGAVLPFTYGIKQIARGSGDATAVILVAVGLVVGALMVLRQTRIANPLLDLTLFARRAFSVGLLAFGLTTFAMFGVFFFVSQYLQLVLGLTPLAAAAWGLPGLACMTLGTMVVVPRLAARYAAKTLMSAGALIMVVGLAAIATLQTSTPPAVAALVVVVFQIGVAPIVTLGMNMVIGSAPPESAGAASGTAQTFNEMSGALGIALLGSLGTAIYRHRIGEASTAGVRDSDVHAVHDTMAGAQAAAGRIPGPLLHSAQDAFTHGMGVIGLITAVLMLAVAAACSRWLPGRQVEPAADAQPAALELA